MPNTEQISDLGDCRRALEEARAGKSVLLAPAARGGFTRVGYLEYDKVRIALNEAGRGTSEGARKGARRVARDANEPVR